MKTQGETGRSFRGTYRLRREGTDGSNINVSIPFLVIRREAACRNLPIETFVEKFLGEWTFGESEELTLRFVDASEKRGAQHE